MWRPNEVISKHRAKAALLWVSIILGVFIYASLLLAHARRKQKNPGMSFAFTDEVYQYPDMGICIYKGFGCDGFSSEACAKSSNMTENGSPLGIYRYLWLEPPEAVDYVVTSEGDTASWCVEFKTSQVTNITIGAERMKLPQDSFHLGVSWYPGAEAGASNTCVQDEASWTPHIQKVLFYMTDPETKVRSTSAPIPYTCVTNTTDSYINQHMTIGLTDTKKLGGGRAFEYKVTRGIPLVYKSPANPDLQHPYARVAMNIHQETNSYETITEVDPMDIAEIFGNVGGFWDLLMIFWPIFFVAVSTQNPTLKSRNFKKSVLKGKEVAVVVTASTTARFSSSFKGMSGSFRRKNSSSGAGAGAGAGKVGASSRRNSFTATDMSRRSSFAATENASFSGRLGSFRQDDSSSAQDDSSSAGVKSEGGSVRTEGQEAKTETEDALDQSTDSNQSADQSNIVMLGDLK